MVKCVSILGSTGSIGRQSLDIIRRLPEVRVAALTAGSSVERMAEQCREFRPELAVMATEAAAKALAAEIADLPIRVSWGEEGLIEAATIPDADCVITAVVGMVGLKPTLAAIRAKKRIGLGHRRQLFLGHAKKWPAGAGQDQALDLLLVPAAHQALENGRMLRVDGDDLRAGCARRGLHELPGADHGLFVGKGNALFLVDGRERRPQGGKAAHRCDDSIGLRQRRSLTQRLAARQHPYIHIRKTGL